MEDMIAGGLFRGSSVTSRPEAWANISMGSCGTPGPVRLESAGRAGVPNRLDLRREPRHPVPVDVQAGTRGAEKVRPGPVSDMDPHDPQGEHGR